MVILKIQIKYRKIQGEIKMIKYKKLIALMAVCGLAVVGVGCASGAVGEQNRAENTVGNSQVEEAQTVTISHQYGEVTVPKNPTSVAVFDFGILDTLQKLGVESITGIPKDASSRPAYLDEYAAKEYSNIGGLKEANFEALYELQPEIIFISGRLAPSYEELSKIAPVVYMAPDNADYMGSLKNNVATLAEIFGEEGEAEEIISTIEEKAAKIEAAVVEQGSNALITMVNKGEVSVYGKVSRFGMIHNTLGFKPTDANIDDSTHGQTVTFEYLAEVNPDYLFVVDKNAISGGSETAKDTLNNPIVANMKVAKEDKVIYLNPTAWYITPGGLTASGIMIDEVGAALGIK